MQGKRRATIARIYAGLRGSLRSGLQIIREKIRRRSSSPDLDGAEWLGLGCAGGGLGPFAAGHLCGMGASGEQSPLGDGLEAAALAVAFAIAIRARGQDGATRGRLGELDA